MELLTTTWLLALVAGLLLTGVIAGILAGLLGVGGGIVIVPVLFILFDTLKLSPVILMHMAVGTSLACIIPTSIASARAHHRRGAIDVSLLRGWAPWVLAGAVVGGVASRYLSSGSLTAVFGVLALVVALHMLVPVSLRWRVQLPGPWFLRTLAGTAIGGLSVLMGIGGGTLSVPVLTLMSFPVHRAVGTAAAFGFVIAVPGTLGFIWSGWGAAERLQWSIGYVNVPAAIVIVTASVLAAPHGSRLAHRLDAHRLRQVFGVFLLISAIRMLVS